MASYEKLSCTDEWRYENIHNGMLETYTEISCIHMASA